MRNGFLQEDKYIIKEQLNSPSMERYANWPQLSMTEVFDWQDERKML